MELTRFLEVVDKLQQAGKIDNLQQVCGVFGCVEGLHIDLVPYPNLQGPVVRSPFSLNGG